VLAIKHLRSLHVTIAATHARYRPMQAGTSSAVQGTY
jgi:hypothetical protein